MSSVHAPPGPNRRLSERIADIGVLVGGGRTDARLGDLRRSAGQARTAACMAAEAAAFDQIYRESDGDPWGVRNPACGYQSWKYEVMIDALPAGVRFARALDLGCGAGVLTQRLARRCDHITGIDISDVAIAFARRGEYGCDTAFVQADIEGFLAAAPAQSFDLVVVADTLYYLAFTVLQADALDALVASLARVLRPQGHILIANHYVPLPVDHASRVAQRVQSALRRSPALTRVGRAQRLFFLIDVFQATGVPSAAW